MIYLRQFLEVSVRVARLDFGFIQIENWLLKMDSFDLEVSQAIFIFA